MPALIKAESCTWWINVTHIQCVQLFRFDASHPNIFTNSTTAQIALISIYWPANNCASELIFSIGALWLHSNISYRAYCQGVLTRQYKKELCPRKNMKIARWNNYIFCTSFRKIRNHLIHHFRKLQANVRNFAMRAYINYV